MACIKVDIHIFGQLSLYTHGVHISEKSIYYVSIQVQYLVNTSSMINLSSMIQLKFNNSIHFNAFQVHQSINLC